MSDANFLTRELKENPEFYKAYPHLAPEEFRGESKTLQDKKF
jgi:hypothetical protein